MGRGGVPELEETEQEAGNFTNRHVNVNVWKSVGKVGMEIVPGSLVKGNHLSWDASKDFHTDVVGVLVDNELPNLSNVPEGKVVGEP